MVFNEIEVKIQKYHLWYYGIMVYTIYVKMVLWYCGIQYFLLSLHSENKPQ